MIISRMRRGLGNQLFRYATGHSFAKQPNRSHFLDIRFYMYENLHQFDHESTYLRGNWFSERFFMEREEASAAN